MDALSAPATAASKMAMCESCIRTMPPPLQKMLDFADAIPKTALPSVRPINVTMIFSLLSIRLSFRLSRRSDLAFARLAEQNSKESEPGEWLIEF